MKYQPHEYQSYATRFILEHPVAAVFLQMGLGKSVITLTAIHDLIFNRFEVRRVLVIAPLRVARDTWPAEIEKWDHLKGLTYSVAVGDEHARNAALMRDAQVYIINRENVSWLVEDSAIPFDYDMIVVDELSSFPRCEGIPNPLQGGQNMCHAGTGNAWVAAFRKTEDASTAN